jgi:hypothetical protein
VAIRAPVGGNQFDRGRDGDADRRWNARQSQEVADDEAKGHICGAPFGGRLSSMWLCTPISEMGNERLEYRHRCTAGTTQELESESCSLRWEEGTTESALSPVVAPS